MNIEEIYWHDGIFVKLTFGKSGEIEFTCELFEDYQASSRAEYKVLFSDVKSTTFSADYFELIDNSRAGNITSARFFEYEDCNCLRVYLVDGYLEVKASELAITKS